MADASCSGPSPFKRLVEHQNRDVSHHQDRLVDHGPQGQHGSFRSTPSPAGQQSNFGSFINSNTVTPGATHHAAGRLAAHAAALEPARHAQMHPTQLRQQSSHQDMSNWAADFARFSNSPAPQNSQFSPPATAQQVTHQLPQQNFHAAFAQPNLGYAPMYGPTNGGFMNPQAAAVGRPAQEADFDDEMSRWMAANSRGPQNAKAMEDVDAVMEQMARELELNDSAFKEAEVPAMTTLEGPAARFTDLEGVEFGNLSPTPQTEEQDLPVEKGRSDVSEAAERLLDSVKHEDGDKWKNSVFLSLMRDFRDGKKDIVGDEIHETDET